MKYLIVKCIPLNDQYECDCARIPFAVTDNWRKKARECNNFYEVYRIQDENLECIKEWNELVDEGMALYFFYGNENYLAPPHVVRKFSGRTREQVLPKSVQVRLEKVPQSIVRAKKDIDSCGYTCWTEQGDAKHPNKIWYYGEYRDNWYAT